MPPESVLEEALKEPEPVESVNVSFKKQFTPPPAQPEKNFDEDLFEPAAGAADFASSAASTSFSNDEYRPQISSSISDADFEEF